MDDEPTRVSLDTAVEVPHLTFSTYRPQTEYCLIQTQALTCPEHFAVCNSLPIILNGGVRRLISYMLCKVLPPPSLNRRCATTNPAEAAPNLQARTSIPSE